MSQQDFCSLTSGMTLLTDDDIREAEIVLPLFEKTKTDNLPSYGLQSYGYDITADSVRRVVEQRFDAIDVADLQYPDYEFLIPWSGYVIIRPGEAVEVTSAEWFHMPEDVIGLVQGKSTYARVGLLVNCTPIEPGWQGKLKVGVYNCALYPIKFYVGNAGFAQVMFYRTAKKPAQSHISFSPIAHV